MNTKHTKTWKLAIAYIAIMLLFIETTSFLFVEYLLPPRLEKFFRIDMDALKDNVSKDTFMEVPDMFDPELGWDIPPHREGGSEASGCRGKDWKYTIDEKGSRDIPVPYNNRVISLYGDSYTFGAEVNNDKTWQYFLSSLTETHVENYAVWGYGPDQALLKLKRNLESGLGTPIVILGIYSENIKRIVGTYRSFLTGDFSSINFKPVLIEEDGRYRWDKKHLMDSFSEDNYLHSFNASKKNDYWYAINMRKPRKTFPYTWTLGQISKYIIFDYMLSSRNMWNNERAQGPFREIVRQFRQLSEQHGFLPILVFMPEAGELEGYARGKPSYYTDFLQQLEADGDLQGLSIVDIYKERFDPRKFTYWDETETCHPSEHGNKIIAQAIMTHLGEIISARIKLQETKLALQSNSNLGNP